jgi:hypothetical protein
MRMHLDDSNDFDFVSYNHIDGPPFFVQVNGPLSGSAAFKRMVMPTGHFSNFFQTIPLDIANPLLELNPDYS